MDGSGHDESSSSRRERLLALRSAANAPPPPPPSAAPSPSLLPDPDLAGDPDQSAARQPHRFDYYTNPAAAFSSSSGGGGGGNPHKRKSPPACYAPPLPQPYGSGSNYPPPNHHHMGPSPINTPSAMHQDAPGSRPWRNPMQYQDRISGYQGAPVTPPWGPHFGSAGRGSYTNSSDFGFRHPNPGGGGSPMNYYRPRGSPHTSYGRGRGQNYNSSPGSWGRGGRGGVGFQNNSGQDCRSYFNKSMVYDPWQDLQPIVGNILIPRGGSRSWLPESLREKKETSAHGQIKSTSSGMSLAEYLDLSFNEACSEK